jgi:ABC-type multidrug transport system fused ATPase/permease subunit
VILGDSGTGKSTLLRAIVGDLPLTGGRIVVGDLDLAALDSETRHASIGVVHQDAYVFEGPLWRNLLPFLERDEPDDEPLGQLHRVRLEAALERVGMGDFLAGLDDGLDTSIGPNGFGLSGGQRRRIAIARGLTGGHRDLLLFDEPTSNLGRRDEAEVIDALRTATEGRTTVVATHSERLALALGTRIVRLGPGGHIVAEGRAALRP